MLSFVVARRVLGSVLACAALVAAGVGCGGADETISIPPFDHPTQNMAVGQTFSMTVKLNRPPAKQVSVIIEVGSTLTHTLGFNPGSLTFAPGQRSKVLEVTGKAATGGRFAEVTFSIPESGASQILRVKVDVPTI